MKFTFSITALVAVMGLVLASAPVSLQAQTPAPAPAAPAAAPAKAAKPTEYAGNVTAIDASGASITVATTAKVLTLAIAPTTKFKKDKKKATLADFAVGDAVTGSYTTDATGAMTAYSVHKKTAKAPATPAAPAAPAAPATH